MSASSSLSVAVVGATGAVGEVLLALLEERALPVGQLRPLASRRSAGQQVCFRGRPIAVEEARPEAFDGVDLVFFAATGALSRSLAPEAVRRGAVVIDKSSSWRMDPAVPLVVPEVNGDALEGHRGIIASPNCTTTGIVMALEPIRRLSPLRHVVITTLQAVTGAGRPGLEELEAQEAGSPATGVFGAPIHRNAVPHCDAFDDDGYTGEETKLQQELRKILASAPQGGEAEAALHASVTCVRVPVPVGHSASLLVETAEPVSPERAREALAAFPNVRVIDEPAKERYPTAHDAAGIDDVLVGRIRRDRGSDRLWLWQVADNLRKGAATNAVQIAEALRERGLV